MKGYRTVIFNIIMVFFMILLATGVIAAGEVPEGETVNTFLDNLDVVLLGVTSVVNIFLRLVTTGPVGTKL